MAARLWIWRQQPVRDLAALEAWLTVESAAVHHGKGGAKGAVV